MRRLAVNVDVDSLHLYHAIHGLNPSDAGEAAWADGVPRFLSLFEELGIRATFFVVASDLEREIPREIAALAVSQGHELASHSWSHPYNLAHMDRVGVLAEIERAEAPIAAIKGSPVRGFRAPGYNLSETMVDVLIERGYSYDSSIFPCPAYYAARATIIGAMQLFGRTSASIVGNPVAAFSSRSPHQLRGTLQEYPISVLPGVRFPIIGTSITLMGRNGVMGITPVLRRMGFINLEFHALDLLDDTDAVQPKVISAQPDLRISVREKYDVYKQLIEGVSDTHINDTLESFSVQN